MQIDRFITLCKCVVRNALPLRDTVRGGYPHYEINYSNETKETHGTLLRECTPVRLCVYYIKLDTYSFFSLRSLKEREKNYVRSRCVSVLS